MSNANTKTRDSALNSIKRYLNASKCQSTEIELEGIEGYLQLLNEQWNRFCRAQEEVEISCGVDNAEIEEQARIQAETWYMTAQANFNRLSKVLSKSAPINLQPMVTASIKLPKMQLPIFCGDSADWISFHDSFQSLVHNNMNLADGQKLHYLRSCLKGDALQVINSFKICDANYAEAWDLLTSGYKVMRVIVDNHLKAICSLEKSSKDSASEIKLILGSILQHVRALRALGRPVEFWEDWLVHWTVSKLAFEIRKQWELSLVSDELPTFEQLEGFLQTRARSLEMLTTASTFRCELRKSSTNVLHAVDDQKKFPQSYSQRADGSLRCLYCKSNHKIYSCQQFERLNPTERLVAIKQSTACLNCLSNMHSDEECRSQSTCRICHRRHNTLLHHSFATNTCSENRNAAVTSAADSQIHRIFSVDGITISAQCLAAKDVTEDSAAVMPIIDTKPRAPLYTSLTSDSISSDGKKAILLATAVIYIQDHAGCWQPIRDLFDNGSHASFATETCIQRLRLPRKPSSTYVTGIGSSNGGKVRGETLLTVSTQFLAQLYKINALILAKITNNLPTVSVQKSLLPKLHNLQLADPFYATPGPIDVLIGMDEMEKFILSGFHKGPPGTPMAQNTVFGWVLFGNTTKTDDFVMAVPTLYTDLQLIRTVSKFWELEELPQKKHITAEEAFCEDFFEKTSTRAADGRFIVRLPIKSSVPLGESRSAAIRSLLRTEKRFVADDELRLQYSEFMHELLRMGHMEPVHDMPTKCFYMPHHAVLKSSSTTTKLRVVFNASMKTSSGFSLNDALMIGPQLQQYLFSILVRFRTHRFAITADVEKMYRQVYVAADDVNYQRIVWRSTPEQPIQDYRLLRVTYGIASASHLAVKSLQEVAANADEVHRQAADIIVRDFYMDDLLSGSSSIEDLKAMQRDVSNLLATAGFRLRKWATNCSEFMVEMLHPSKHLPNFLADGHEIRTLGVVWNTHDDFLTFTVNIDDLKTIALTKREFLSDSSTLFDPLGLIAPCTIRSKIWLQQIWRANVDWDESVPTDIAKEWVAHRNDLKKLSALKLNRWLGTGQPEAITEYHIFTDASERAYAAALYSRTLLIDGSVKVNLFAARAKVAPLKTTTLPRLELCAAHLGAKLVRQTLASLENTSNKLFAWTDSTITLAWLQGHPSRWSTFVANRVAEVQEVLPPECWGHVTSEHNPADCASRGTTPSELLRHHLWWNGPNWLQSTQAENYWHQRSPSQHTTSLEQRKIIAACPAEVLENWDFLSKFSSYAKLNRVTAYLCRFAHNIKCKIKKSPQSRKFGPLTSEETRNAELILVRYTQINAFSKEINLCRMKKSIPLRSNLVKLQPFLDANEILRVGGRLSNAAVSVDVKHPMILPKNSPLAKSIVIDIHKITLHAGPQIMQTVLQRRFWVPGARNRVRQIYHNCCSCTRMNRQPLQQAMSDLPLCRVSSSRCFLSSAVDFAGPFSLKFSQGRGAETTKGYISAFECMATGAMHLELVGDLPTAAFIAAFKCFINRRGYCQQVFSDNGTNFVGAKKELQNTLKRCMADEGVCRYFADSCINWHFNPPSAPHMGGYWEAGIKRVKYHIKRVINSTLLTYEEFNTLLTEVEACVNSRPLCAQSSNVNDLEILTPGHFIAGEPLKALPEYENARFSGTLGQRWHTISSMRQHFWKRWRDEYLLSRQRRSKWFRPKLNLELDDVVVIHDDRVPPTKWKLGKVIQRYPGADGHIRVVKMKTADGEIVRPVVKLSLLPTKDALYT